MQSHVFYTRSLYIFSSILTTLFEVIGKLVFSVSVGFGSDVGVDRKYVVLYLLPLHFSCMGVLPKNPNPVVL